MTSRIITTIVASLVPAGLCLANTIDVNHDGSGDYTSIQAAIDASLDGDTIQVATGTYFEHDIDPDGRAITIQGELNSDGSPAVIVDAQEQGTVFVFQSFEGLDTRIDGLEIARGTGSNVGGYNIAGGIYCSNSSPTISNCVIRGNRAQAGAGILCSFASPTITGCTFSDNKATVYDGGGIHCANSSPDISNCVLSGNTAERHGAGIYVGLGAQVDLAGCVVSGGTANGAGGGIYCELNSTLAVDGCSILDNVAVSGGGLYANSAELDVVGCSIVGNQTTTGSGGGISMYSGNILLRDCEFIENVTTYGGGIYCNNSSPTIDTVVMSGNQATVSGGGLYGSNGSSPAMANCSILDNVAGGSSPGEGGGVAFVDNCEPILTGCTISSNMAGVAGGIQSIASAPTIIATMVCGNDPDQVVGTVIDGGGNTVSEGCPNPLGTCCTHNDQVCVENVTEGTCASFGGTWIGVGGSCSDCPVPEDLGACCVNGLCSVMTDDQCFDVDGAYAGDNVACDDAGCPDYCLGDINDDGQVGIVDILIVIDRWGLCP